MAKKESPHVVVNQRRGKIAAECLHCFAKLGVELPCRIDDWCDAMRKFEARHRDCIRPDNEPTK